MLPPLRHPLTIFCGKGGVGKTTLAVAHALGYARQGKRALVVTSHPLPELAVSLSLAGLKEKAPQAAASLFVIHIDPRELLQRAVRQHIPSQALAGAVVSSRIYQSLIEVAPGLKEIVFLERLREFAVRQAAPEDAGGYDLVVWDAPATGHFLQTLNVSRHFKLYLSGPFAALGRNVARFFSDPANLALFPVTTLEEMAVEETAELVHKLAELEMRPRAVVCNMTSPALAGTATKGIAAEGILLPAGADDPGLRFILDRLVVERALFERLRSEISVSATAVERRHRAGTDLDLLLELSERMGEMLES
jgi:arsenite-transporting ATPase